MSSFQQKGYVRRSAFDMEALKLHNQTVSTGKAMVVSLGPDAMSIYALPSDLCQDPPSGILLH